MKKQLTVTQQATVNYIVTNAMHERYTISLIKKIASLPQHHCNTTCIEFMNGGYTDFLIEDIKQEIFITLYELVIADELTLDTATNQLVFGTYFNKSGNEKNSYLKLYRTFENVIYASKKDNSSTKTVTYYDKVLVEDEKIKEKKYDESGEVIFEKSESRFHYVTMECKKSIHTASLSFDDYNCNSTTSLANNKVTYHSSLLSEKQINNIAFRSDVKSVFRILKVEYPKHFTNICKVFHGRILGLTYDEIAEKNGLTKDKVRYCMDILRKVFSESIFNVDIEKEECENIISNHGNVYYINRNKSVTNVEYKEYWKHWKPYEKPFVSSSYPLACGILDAVAKEEIAKSRKINNDIENVNFVNVFNTRTQHINVLNDRGKLVFDIPCYTVNTACKMKKTLPNI